MPSSLITGQDILRYIHRSTDDSQSLPNLHTLDGGYVDIYKGEILVNYSRDQPALYIRAGGGTNESIEDSLVRIGNVIVSDAEPYVGQTTVNKEGLAWYNTYDKELYIHNGQEFKQVTSSVATELITGISRIATLPETILGEEDSAVVSPKKLKGWSDYYEFNQRRWGTKTVHVCNYDGDDSADNDGSDPSRPFLTINRALLEVGRRQVQTVYVQSGDYLIDNRPGVSDPALIAPFAKDINDNAVGPINPQNISGTVSQLNIDGNSGFFTITGGTGWSLYKDQQIFFVYEGEIIGNALVESALDIVTTTPVYFRKLRGSAVDGCSIQVGYLASFNAISGGVILPTSCHLVAQGSVFIRPLFIPNHTPVEITNRSYLFKSAQGCTIQGFIFKDATINASHFLYSCLTNASGDDLFLSDYSISAKLKHVFGIGDTLDTLYVNYLPFLRLVDVSVVSYYGMSLLDLNSSYIDGYKDVVMSNVCCASSQQDLNFLIDGEPVETAQHWLVKVDGLGYTLAINGGYVRYTPELIILPEGYDTTVNIDGIRWDP